MQSKIYLIPTPINTPDYPMDISLPGSIGTQIGHIDYFVVENIRSARRFLSRLKLPIAIDNMEFVELSEHTHPSEVEAMLTSAIKQNRDIGIISEAGLPCIADPGALLVAAAHQHGIQCIPLVGPSSIMMALMASGANGQSFAFNGYLPVKSPDRIKAIQKFEKRLKIENQTQIFIETPYRNLNLWKDFLATLSPNILLTIGCDISASNSELIKTLSVEKWRKTNTPDIQKRPAIFILSQPEK